MAETVSGPRAAQIQAAMDLLVGRLPDNGPNVDEIGHPVTDEPAPGPELRAQLAEANERADQGEARGWAKAVQALLDVDRYRAWWRQVDSTDDDFVRMPDRRALARYLEAVGPDGTADGDG